MRTGKRQMSLPRSPQSRRRGVSVETRAGECFTIPNPVRPVFGRRLARCCRVYLKKLRSPPSFECLSLCVSLAQREFGSSGRDCRITKMRERDARAAGLFTQVGNEVPAQRAERFVVYWGGSLRA